LANLCTANNELQAQVTDLNAYVVQLTRTTTRTRTNTKQQKDMISNPELFKKNRKKIKENQKLFLTFTAQVELKMIGDKHCFASEKEQIIYVASRISDSVYKNIKF